MTNYAHELYAPLVGSSFLKWQNTSWPTPTIPVFRPNTGANSKELLKARIRAIGKLEDDWDGYGAAGVDKDITRHASALIELPLRSPTYVRPHPAGTIIFEWESESGSASLEIGKTKYSFYAKPEDGEAVVDGGLIAEFDGEKTFILSCAIEALVLGRMGIPAASSSKIEYSYPSVTEQYSY
jgi:hypothetical protein